MDWFAKSVSLAYFKTHDKPLKNKWVRLRGVAVSMGLSPKAREKLEWMIFYHTVGKRNAKRTSEYFGVSRKTFHKWLSRFDERNLKSLEEYSRAPATRRTWTVTPKEEANIIFLRRKSKRKWGKEKLRARYKTVFGEEISTNKIQKVIDKHNLYPDPTEHNLRLKRKKRREKKKKVYIHTFEKKPLLSYLWHTDTIILWWYGVRRVIFTALEETTKIAVARVYTNSTSSSARDFLERLLYLSNGSLQNIHHDNGGEFAGLFERACEELGINQIYSRVRRPKDNPALERFNGTVQDEWLAVSEIGLDNIHEANQDLTDWLIQYNSERPHQSLDYLSPLTYATQKYKVSPMWAARTVN